MHMISSVALRSNEIPTNLHPTKYYFNSDIEYLMQEFEHVKSLGSAALEEWIKGLESKGKRKMADAARWEQWENSGGLDEARLQSCGRLANNNDPRRERGRQSALHDTSRPEDPLLTPIEGVAHHGISPDFINSKYYCQS